MTNYSMIQWVIDDMDHYVKTGDVYSDFLRAVITNDLRKAFERADDFHAANMKLIVMYLYNKCPNGCWGRSDSIENWQKYLQSKREEEKNAN